MSKHVFEETEVLTSYGERARVLLCKNCMAPEFDRGKCSEYLSVVRESEAYLEKALKAVASV